MARRILNGTTSRDRLDASLLPSGDWVSGRLYDGDDVFTGSDGADRMAGDGGNDTLFGGLGNDTLLGGAGQDSLSGGEGQDLLDGGLGDDTLDGGAGDDQLLGGAGLDSLIGGDGADLLDGGDGNDTLIGGDGQDTLRGGAGDDRLDAGDGNDLLQAGEGNNTVLGGLGEDSIVAGAGNDSIEGQAGDDVIATGAGSNFASGGAGDDDITGGSGNDTLSGDDGNDVISAGAGNDSIFGGAGDDLIDTGEGSNWVDAGTGDDSVIGGGGNDTILAGEGNNTVLGGAGTDSIIAGEGDDSLLGEAGNDAINAGAGANVVSGGLGNDSITAGAGADSISGDDGNDTLNAGDGDNTILGGIGNDSIIGGLGDDSILGGEGDDIIKAGAGANQVDGGLGRDRITTDAGDDVILGGGGNDTIVAGDGSNVIDGGDDNDAITAGNDDDEISGGAGNDSIQAGGGANLVEGEAGNDTIEAGAGDDRIIGGAGADVIRAGDGDNHVDAGSENDTVTTGQGRDNVLGGAGNDTISTGGGDDAAYGNDGNDKIMLGAGDDFASGDAGQDSILGGDGLDTLYGGLGNDTLAGEAGTDQIFGDGGNDLIIHALAQKTLVKDEFWGGIGTDTLRVDFTRAEWFLTTTQAEIVRLVGALNTQAARRGGEVVSETFGTKLHSIETLGVTVDGVALSTEDDAVGAVADAFTVADGASVSGSLVGNDVVPDLIALVELNSAAPALGSLVITTDGGFRFTTGRAFESLAVGEAQDVLFTYRVTDADGDTGTAQVTLTVQGSNDAASITGGDRGNVTEDDPGEASGVLSVLDVDHGEARFAAPASLAGSYGAFSFDALTGVWSYALDSSLAQVQALKARQTLTDKLTVTSFDGTASQDILVTINGANDAASISGSSMGSVAEDGVLTASGTLSVADPDSGEAGFATPASLAGTYGTFSFDVGTGAWDYVLDNAAAHVQALGAGQSVTDSLTVSSLDGTASQVVSVTIAGANDVAAITISGATPVMPVISLNSVAGGVGGYKIYGEAFNDQAGVAITSVGDMNGDGLPEVLLGAHLNGAGGFYAGAGYVVFGKADGVAVNLDQVAGGTGGFKIVGENVQDRAGFSLSSIGDLNGDGRADLLISAPGNDAGGSDGGAAYVVWGKADGTTVNLDDVSRGTGGYKIQGEGRLGADTAGYAVSAIADLNGDGLPEILLTAPEEQTGGRSSGAAYVVFGKSGVGTVKLTDVADGNGGYKIFGEGVDNFLGYSIASVADLNGDGRAELLVGAHLNGNAGGTNAGAAYLVFGKTDGTAINLSSVAAGTGGFKIIGENGQDQAGRNVTSISDLNGDGLAELVIAAPGGDMPGNGEAGAVYVVWGKSNTTTVNLDDVAVGRGGFKIYGEEGDALGSAVASIGDLNGDGLAELLIGSESDSGNYNNNSDHGSAYLVFGKATGTAVSTATISAGIGGYKIHAEASGGYAGRALGAIGDLNGDGLPEVLVSAYLNNNEGGGQAGAAYVVFGQAPLPAPSGVAENGLLTLGGAVTVADADAGQSGFVVPASLVGTHGSFTLNAATGAWGYTLNNAAANVQALVTGQSVTDSIVITSTDGSASKSLVVSIAGQDDAAAITGPATGSVAEDGALTASGMLSVADPDAGQAGFAAPASLAGSYGMFSFNAGTGAWGYALNNGGANVQALKTGQSVTDSLTVTSLDGMANQIISVSIAGQDDAAVISGTTTASVAEDGVLTASGTLSVVDPDSGEAGFATPASLVGSYGTFSFDAGTGAWGYTLDNAAANVQALVTGQRMTESLVVSSLDGAASTTIELEVQGLNDTAVISGSSAGSVAEDGALTASGMLSVVDPDAGQAGFAAPASLAGTYGTFSFNAGTGAWGYALNNAGANVQALAAGQAVTDSLTVTSSDGSASTMINIAIAGANDTAVIGGAAKGNVVEDTIFTVAAKISVTDADAGQSGFQTPASLAGKYGAYAFNATTGDWSYTLNNNLAAVQALNSDQTLSDSILVQSNDGSARRYLIVTIAGKSEADKTMAAVNLDTVAAGNGGFKILGQSAGDNAGGSSLRSIGDLNGDGLAEIVMSGNANDSNGSNAGTTYVIWGKNDGTKLDLDNVAAGNGGYRIIGQSAGSQAGTTFTVVSDLNGDGRDDLVIGAPGDGTAGNYGGSLYVVWGKGDNATINLSDVAAGHGGYKVLAENAYDYVGLFGVSTIGDLNGDGLAELQVAAVEDDAGGSSAGASYVIWGKATGTQVRLSDVARGNGGYKIYGENADDNGLVPETHQLVGSVGDLNGDGRQEVLMTSMLNDAGGTDAGAAYVVWGKADGAAINLDSVALGVGGFKIIGENAGDGIGSIAGISDMNGDGKGEILLAAAGNDAGGSNAGAAYVVWGKSTGTAVNLDDVAAGNGGFKIMGEKATDKISKVAGIADLNGDGLGEIMVSTRNDDTGGSNAGALYVVWGKASGGLVNLDTVAVGVGGFKIYGENAGDEVWDMSSISDLNGDGRPEILVGGWQNDEAGVDAGAAYVIYSSADWVF